MLRSLSYDYITDDFDPGWLVQGNANKDSVIPAMAPSRESRV